MAKKKNGTAIKLKGFVRLGAHNVRTGEVTVTPWYENVITANGFLDYICNNIGSNLSGGKKLAFLQLASQTDAPTSSQNTASGEFTGTDGARMSTSNSTSANGTIQGTAAWATNEGNQSAIGAVAWYNTSSSGTAGSIATFSTSQKTTDQTLSITYQWRFS